MRPRYITSLLIHILHIKCATIPLSFDNGNITFPEPCGLGPGSPANITRRSDPALLCHSNTTTTTVEANAHLHIMGKWEYDETFESGFRTMEPPDALNLERGKTYQVFFDVCFPDQAASTTSIFEIYFQGLSGISYYRKKFNGQPEGPPCIGSHNLISSWDETVHLGVIAILRWPAKRLRGTLVLYRVGE